MKNTLTCVVVDDSNTNIFILQKFIEKTDFLTLKQSFTNPIEACSYLQSNKTDILFLDIEMPEMTGLELLKALKNQPHTILITSKKEFALEAYDLDVIDYIVKPPEYHRFLKAVNKVAQSIENEVAALPEFKEDEIYIKVESKLIRLSLGQIMYIEALSDYILIHTEDKRQYIVYSTLKAFEEKLRDMGIIKLMRIHRSYIINTNRIDALENNDVIIDGKYIPVGNTYREEFMKGVKKI